MVQGRRSTVVAAVCVAAISGVGCNSSETAFACPALEAGRYSFELTYRGEYTFDGGCPSAHALDGQNVTVEFNGQGGGTLTTPTQTVTCWGTGSWGVDLYCPIPPSDEVVVGLDPGCGDSGVTASFVYLVDASSSDRPTSSCIETYCAR